MTDEREQHIQNVVDFYELDRSEWNDAVLAATDIMDGEQASTIHLDQIELIHETEWDYLLLLDDFRWDAFDALYEEYLDVDATAKPVWSAGSHTLHWLQAAFPETYPDVTYVSGHAFINSMGAIGGIGARREAEAAGLDGDYDAAEHFPDIIDAWDWGYAPTIETVPPTAINDVLTGTNPHTDRPAPPVLAHYVQPHFPWVRGHLYAEEHDWEIEGEYREEWNPGRTNDGVPQFRRGWVEDRFGMEGVRRAYRDNCCVALDGVSEVLPSLHGTVVVTSDHGELFESGVTHPPGRDDEELRTVPWLVIEK